MTPYQRELKLKEWAAQSQKQSPCGIETPDAPQHCMSHIERWAFYIGRIEFVARNAQLHWTYVFECMLWICMQSEEKNRFRQRRRYTEHREVFFNTYDVPAFMQIVLDTCLPNTSTLELLIDAIHRADPPLR